jgi:uncharacterized membrane protein YcaP (DUF421 family)
MDIALRAIAIFFFIFLLTRVLGKRELSSLEPFDLIVLIVLGDAVQQGLTQDDYSVTGAIIAVSTLAVLQVLTSYVSFRFPRMRVVLEGDPVVIVQDGKPIEHNLRRERLTVEEVAAEARQTAQIDSLDKVQWAVVETNGTISFIEKQ